MSADIMAAMDRRAPLPQPSLRSPMSYPPMFGNLSTGPGRDSLPLTGTSHRDRGAQNGVPSAADLSPRDRAQPIEDKEEITIDNVLTVGDDPAFFNTMKSPTRLTSCHHCGLFGSRRCSQCHETYYCSVECQMQDWKVHSVICKPAAAKMTKGGETKTLTKPLRSPPPVPRKEEEDGRRVMLCDLKVALLSEGKEMKGYVSEFSSPSNFFVQEYDAKPIENLIKFSALLNNIYSSPENVRKDYVPEILEVCAAKYSQDQQWYRVLVYHVELNVKTAQVLYLDYGNQETLSLSELQPMHKDIELAPPCAMNFRVAHAIIPPCGWSPECLVDVKRLLMGQQLVFRIVRVDLKELPRYSAEVSLPETGELLHKVMEEKGYVFISHGGGRSEENAAEVPAVEKCSDDPVEDQKLPTTGSGSPHPQGIPEPSCAGDRFQALITVFHSPDMFFCQRVQNAKQLAELVAAMNKRCNALTTALHALPEAGDVCCAQFTADNNWYRASIVKHISDDTALVGYLDFGNMETLHISRLRPIDDDMLRTPFQASQCCLAGVRPPSGTWSPETIHAIGLIIINKVFTAVVVSESADFLTLELIAESTSPPVVMSQHLIAAGLAEADKSAIIATPSVPKEEEKTGKPPSQLAWAKLPLGQEIEVMVCMLRSPGDFFCHIHNPTDLKSLIDLNVSLGHYCVQHVSKAYTPMQGDVCGAFFSDDGNWYRGQVKDVTPGGAATVHFLDYGNTEQVPVDKLCEIPSSFLDLPFQAIQCSLAGVKPHGDKWDLKAAEIFQNAVAGIKLRAKASSKKENGYFVQLAVSESGEAITDVLLAEKAVIPDDSRTNGGSAAQEVEGGSSPVRSQEEHKQCVKMETKASPGHNSSTKPPMGSFHRDPYSPHSVQPVMSAPPALRDINSLKAATSTPKGSISSNPTPSPSRLNKCGNSAPSLHRESNSSSSFRTEFNGKSVKSTNGTLAARRDSASGCRGFSSAVSPLQSPGRLLSTHDAGRGEPILQRRSKDSSSPPEVKSTWVSHSQLSTARSPPHAEPYNKSNHPSRESEATGESPQRYSSQSPSASQPAPSVCEDLPNPANTTKQSPALPEARGVGAAQSWASVDLPLNEPLAACVLKVTSPDLLYVFPKENRVDVEKLQEVMVDIFSYCNAETERSDYTPCVGDACCAKFAADGQWYRAVILDVSDSTVDIAYADYGNLETLPISCLRPIKESFLRPPMQITRCRLYGVAPATPQGSHKGTQALSSLLLGADVVLTARSVEAGIYSVSMEKEGEEILNIGENLEKYGLAKCAETVPPTGVCKEKDGCCCQELRKRVEKLELLLEKLLVH